MIVGLHSLWLPILLASVAVFIVSSIIHMALPWHKGDYRKVPNEDRMMEALRPLALPPGDYMLPRAGSMEEMKSPEFKKKLSDGPVMMFTVMPPGPFNMGSSMALWFLYVVIATVLVAYVTGRALPFGTPYLRVFRIAGATAFIGHALALWPMSIWYRRSLRATIVSSMDALIYALVTAGFLGWLWPR
ncbi:MAG: hypothetical protein HZB25_07560 [Candidatus Eisenbacteria bacterium]|nr:hypothetical protein [Candidatus Eisenbacteria bacterium]